MRTQGPVFAILAVSVLVPGAAFATAQRTFVASTGSDANPCSIVAPCRSFGAAIVQTTDGGDIVVLDSAGYGPVVVTKSVAITAPPGVFAGISVFSGKGVDIPTAGLRVVIRGLTITGISGGNVGIYVGAASDVTIERCDIATMLDYGIRADASGAVAHILDTVVRGSAIGISSSGAVDLTLVRTRTEGNAGDGLQVFNGTRADIRDSVTSHNGLGLNVTSASGFATFTKATVEALDASQNAGGGIWVYTVNGNIAHLSASHSVFADNAGPGVRVESTTSTDHSLVSIVDSQFARNQNGIEALTGSSGFSILIIDRNVFQQNGNAVAGTPSTQFYSGGHNLGPLEGLTPAPLGPFGF